MLKAANRLKKDRDFNRVMSAGTKALYGPLLIFTTPGESTESRFGVTVSKKVSHLAVQRNKIRRQIGELLRPVAEKATAPRDVVLLVLRLTEFEEYQKGIEQWQKKSSSS